MPMFIHSNSNDARMYPVAVSAITTGRSTWAGKPYISGFPRIGEGLRLNSAETPFSLCYCLGNLALASAIKHFSPQI